VKILDAARKNLEPYAWPGGYPILYLVRDGWRGEDGTLDFNPQGTNETVCCPTCARDTDKWPDLIIVASWIFYEGPVEFCEWCNAPVESAYGDPDEFED